MKRWRPALALSFSVALSACGGATPRAPSPPATAPGSASTGFVYNTFALQGAAYAAPAHLAALSIDVIPKLANPAGLFAYAQAVANSHNGSYRHFLTPQEIGARYGASSSDYQAATAYFKSFGMLVAGWPQRLLLHVSGTQAQMQAALHTTFAWYTENGNTFLAPESTPSPPASVPIVGSMNLVKAVSVYASHIAVQPHTVSDGMAFGYSPQQIATAFDYTGAYAAGYTGSGITVGVIGTGGFSSGDVPAYKALFGIGGSSAVTLVSATDADDAGNAATGFASPPPITAPCFGSSISPTPSCNPEDGETQLDTEQVSSLAYNASVRYYLAYNPNDDCGVVGAPCPPGAGIPLQGLGEIDEELQTAIADNASDILSLSFGGPEAAQLGVEINANGLGIEPLEFAALASEGIAIFVSSGDTGAETCRTWQAAPDPNSLCVSYPSTDPNVVSVGGVNTPLNGEGQFIGPITAWGSYTMNGAGGSGGGVSAYFALPSFQQGAAGVQGAKRNVPDISFEADPFTGVSVLLYGAPAFAPYVTIEPVGGTSVATPEMAAMWALVLQSCAQHPSCAKASGAKPYRLGDPNPLLYKFYANAASYAAIFTDVLYGNNADACIPTGSTPCPQPTDPGYAAGKGYDLVTGIGVPYALPLIQGVTGS